MTLTEFLLARIAEDEAVARGAVRWSEGASDWADSGEPDWVHIARFDPARVLAECEAKRRVLALHRTLRDIQPVDEMTYPEAADTCASCGPGDHWSWQELSEKWLRGWCPTLAALTLPYADHPDFDESWRV